MSGEYIDRGAAMEIIKRTSGDYAAAWTEVRKLPAADVAPVVHGRWKHEVGDCWYCSACGIVWQVANGQTPERNDMRFCPCCGAKMDGGDEQ